MRNLSSEKCSSFAGISQEKKNYLTLLLFFAEVFSCFFEVMKKQGFLFSQLAIQTTIMMNDHMVMVNDSFSEEEPMAEEKEQAFRVTDRRAAFREEAEVKTEPSEPEQASETDQTKETTETTSAQTHKDADEAQLLPEANLLTLVLSFSTHAQISMGLVADPMTQKVEKHLPLAKYNIDMLAMLKEKTRGNLTKEEEDILEDVLYQLRMQYVQVNR